MCESYAMYQLLLVFLALKTRGQQKVFGCGLGKYLVFLKYLDVAWILRISLIFMLMKNVVSVGPNAQLAATKRGSQVELQCVYVGNGNVSAVEWFNESSSILTPLILRRNDSEGKFNVFPESKSPFEMDRVNSSCNLSNICILKINLLPIDDNSNISCNFLAPYGSETKARFTLKVPHAPVTSAPDTTVPHAPVTSAPDTTGIPISQTIVTAIVVEVALVLVLVICAVCGFCCRKRGENIIPC